jgi:hypothetical protein
MISIKEEIEVDQNFMVSDRVGLTELDIGDIELLYEEEGRSKKNTIKNQSVFSKDMNDLIHMLRKQSLMLMTFDM